MPVVSSHYSFFLVHRICRDYSRLFDPVFFMAKPWAEKFYKSPQWKRTRELYANSRGNICEKCWEKGLVVPGEIVHHKIFLTPSNINNPDISLGFSNLELLCRNCHAAVHEQGMKKRYKINSDGSVDIR